MSASRAAADVMFLRQALAISVWSKDPNTRVGSVIVADDGWTILSTGYNGLPGRITQTHARMHDRDLKLRLVVHAEMKAVLNAARAGTPLKGSTLYLAATDDSGEIWGGCPCTRCTVEIIQSGIETVVSLPPKPGPSQWHEDTAFAKTILLEAGLTYREGGIV